MKQTVIIDYGMGNLRSVEKTLMALGDHPVTSADPEVVRQAGRLILPGVGAFGDAMSNLKQAGLDQAVHDAVAEGKPLLGLCLGLELLFSESEEFGHHEGLNLITGQVKKFDDTALRVPHVGWNQIESLSLAPIPCSRICRTDLTSTSSTHFLSSRIVRMTPSLDELRRPFLDRAA